MAKKEPAVKELDVECLGEKFQMQSPQISTVRLKHCGCGRIMAWLGRLARLDHIEILMHLKVLNFPQRKFIFLHVCCMYVVLS